jgi:glycosyltransferase involved in cell wall biosynthesis
MIKNLSVFFPAFNEASNIERTVSSAVTVLEKLGINYEIIVVDDGSPDQTGAIADQLSSNNPKIRVIHHPKNLGYGEALRSGFYNAKYEWIVFTDSDGQFDFSEITKFLELADTADLVIGFRMNRQDPPMRKLNAWGWKMINRILMGTNVRDLDCAFKLVKKEVIEKIPKLESTRGGMISPELLSKAKKAGFKIVEVGVHHYPRGGGSPTGASVKVIIVSFVDLFKLWWKLR